LAASTQAAIVDVLVKKSMAALKQSGLDRLVVAGGVASNQHIRTALAALAALPARQLRVYSTRPATVSTYFQTLGRPVESLSLARALLQGQQNRRVRRKLLAASPETPAVAIDSIASHTIATGANGLKDTKEMTNTPQEGSAP
jgi:1-aminocyclopropane-1-carboxylate deaminase/D-cysteine desulfhydrase-like pyridoxal-dependent ACC family enzyme